MRSNDIYFASKISVDIIYCHNSNIKRHNSDNLIKFPPPVKLTEEVDMHWKRKMELLLIILSAIEI